MGTSRVDDGDGCRQVEPVHRQDEQGPAVERERRRLDVEQHHTSEARTRGVTTKIARRDHRSMNTPVNGPRIERQRDDQRRDREPERRALLVRAEHHRGDERRLEEPVGRLGDEPDREQPPEVVAPERLARPLTGGSRVDGRRRPGGGPTSRRNPTTAPKSSSPSPAAIASSLRAAVSSTVSRRSRRRASSNAISRSLREREPEVRRRVHFEQTHATGRSARASSPASRLSSTVAGSRPARSATASSSPSATSVAIDAALSTSFSHAPSRTGRR